MDMRNMIFTFEHNLISAMRQGSQQSGKNTTPKWTDGGSIISWKRDRNMTALCTMSAAGSFITPMFIFQRKPFLKWSFKNSHLAEKTAPYDGA